MGAVGFTSGDPNKVDVTGDTMTGNLTINASLGVTGLGTFGTQVSTPLVTSTLINTSDLNASDDVDVAGTLTADYQGVTGDVMRLLATTLSTAITSGGVFSINADPTKFNVGATEGWIVDYNPTAAIGATNPRLTSVSYPGATAVTVTVAPAVQLFTIMIDSTGALIQQPGTPSRIQYRTHLVLGFFARSGLTIAELGPLSTVQGQLETQFYDLGRALGGFSPTSVDNAISANGANLMINTTGGSVFFPALNLFGNYQDPHVATVTAQAPATFNRMTATSVLAGFFTTIDVANYDPGGLGVITPVGGGANTSTVFRVYARSGGVPGNQMFIQYGQQTFANLTAARDAIGAGTFTVNPGFLRQALVGWIVATRTAANLSDPTQAIFVHASKFAAP